MSDTVTVILSTPTVSNSNATYTSLNNVTFSVNTGAIFSENYSKYKLRYAFRSVNYTGNLQYQGQVNVNFLKVESYENNSSSSSIGFVSSNLIGYNDPGNFYTSFGCDYGDNVPLVVSKPFGNQWTVSISNLGQPTSLIEMYAMYWTIILTFEPYL